MVSLHPEYVVDENDQRKKVVLPLEDWEKIMDELEELDDIRLYDESVQARGDSVPFETAVKEIEEEYGE
jgi:hypothetical protein